MRTNTLLLSLFGLGAIIAGEAMAAPTIKESVIVTGEMVTLGDLITEAGTEAGTVVAVAPQPGETLAFSTADILNLARAKGLTLPERLGPAKVVVERASKTISTKEVADAIAKELTQRGVQGPLGVDLAGRRIDIKLPLQASGEVEIVSLDFDGPTGRFWASVRAPANDPRAERLNLIGRAERVINVPVLKGQLAQGAVLTSKDFETKTLPVSRLPANVITDLALVNGQALRRPLPPGATVQASDIERPQVVQRNALVTMIYVKPGLTLSTTGRAIDAGSIGDVVHVQNTKTNRTVEAIVTGVNEVQIRTLLDGTRTAAVNPGPTR